MCMKLDEYYERGCPKKGSHYKINSKRIQKNEEKNEKRT